MNFSIFWALKSLTSSPLIIKWSYPHFSSSRPSHMLCLTINKHKLPIISVSITPSYDHHLLSFQRTLLLLPQLFNTSRANKWLIPVFYLCPLFSPYLKSMVYYYNLYKTHLQLLALSWFPDSFSENISWKTSDLYSLSTSMAEQDGRKKKKKDFPHHPSHLSSNPIFPVGWVKYLESSLTLSFFHTAHLIHLQILLILFKTHPASNYILPHVLLQLNPSHHHLLLLLLLIPDFLPCSTVVISNISSPTLLLLAQGLLDIIAFSLFSE